MAIKPEEFAAQWLADDPVKTHLKPGARKNWLAPLVRPSEAALEGIEIPESAREFLRVAGLPQKFDWLASDFSTLAESIPLAPEARPDRVDNGVELPRLRYDLMYVIGQAGYAKDSDIAVEKYTGRVYKLAYGSSTYWKRTTDPYGGGGSMKRSDHPILDGQSTPGPFFVSSSIPQMAELFLAFRNTYIMEGVSGKRLDNLVQDPLTGGWYEEPKKCRRMAKRLEMALRRVDEAAVVHPDGMWQPILFEFAEGIA